MEFAQNGGNIQYFSALLRLPAASTAQRKSARANKQNAHVCDLNSILNELAQSQNVVHIRSTLECKIVSTRPLRLRVSASHFHILFNFALIMHIYTKYTHQYGRRKTLRPFRFSCSLQMYGVVMLDNRRVQHHICAYIYIYNNAQSFTYNEWMCVVYVAPVWMGLCNLGSSPPIKYANMLAGICICLRQRRCWREAQRRENTQSKCDLLKLWLDWLGSYYWLDTPICSPAGTLTNAKCVCGSISSSISSLRTFRANRGGVGERRRQKIKHAFISIGTNNTPWIGFIYWKKATTKKERALFWFITWKIRARGESISWCSSVCATLCCVITFCFALRVWVGRARGCCAVRLLLKLLPSCSERRLTNHPLTILIRVQYVLLRIFLESFHLYVGRCCCVFFMSQIMRLLLANNYKFRLYLPRFLRPLSLSLWCVQGGQVAAKLTAKRKA